MKKDYGGVILNNPNGIIREYLDCNNLRMSDEYFKTQAPAGGLIGDILIDDEILQHLTDLVASELKKVVPDIEGSLSVAVFLVWIGIKQYQEGNYWSPVYEVLGLPKEQVKWQTLLGGTFVGAIKKHGLLEITEKQAYTTPILAHGFVPDYYVEKYIKECVFPLIRELHLAGRKVEKDEVVQHVINWRQDYKGFQQIKERIEQQKKEEAQLELRQQTILQADFLKRYAELQGELIKAEKFSVLLSRPENWLAEAEERRTQLQSHSSEFNMLLEEEYALVEAKDLLSVESESIGNQLAAMTSGLFSNWDHTYCLHDIPVDDISSLAQEYQGKCFFLRGFFGRIIKYFLPTTYKKALVAESRLKQAFEPYEINSSLLASKAGADQLVAMLNELTLLLKQHKAIGGALLEQVKSEAEIASEAACLTASVELEDLTVKLDTLSSEIIEYKMDVSKLGKGDFEKGLEALEEMRKLHQEKIAVRAKLQGNPEAMLALLPSLTELKREERSDLLVQTRRQIRECEEKLKIYINPLYMLIESTRAFFFQGGERAVTFFYDSLKSLESLVNGDVIGKTQLPPRITRAIEEWWEKEGQVIITEPGIESRGTRPGRAVAGLIKPFLYLDTANREVRIKFPAQYVDEGKANLTLKSGFGKSKVYVMSAKKVEGGFLMEETSIPLQAPESNYIVEFNCGQDSGVWQIHGPGWDKSALLFGSNKELMESNRLPSKEAWIVAPRNHEIEPEECIREKFNLQGKWSSFLCTGVDLTGIDVLAVMSGKNIDIFKSLRHIEPILVGGQRLHGIETIEGAPVYRELPGLVFSVHDPEELRYYGMHIGDNYRSVAELNPVIDRENVVFIDLKELLKGEYGQFHWSLSYRLAKQSWADTFGIVPGLKVNFDKDIYLPGDSPTDTSRLTVNGEFPFTLTVDPPGTVLISRAGEYVVQFDPGIHSFRGRLECNLGPKTVGFNVRFQVPCLRWKIGEEDWRYQIEEIWHEDTGIIELMVPQTMKGLVRLSYGEQNIETTTKRGVANLDLRKFADAIRESKGPVEEVVVSFPGGSTRSSVLLRVRTRWQVAEVAIKEETKEDQRDITLTWEDLGRARNRVLRMWPLDMQGTAMAQYDIPDGVAILRITEYCHRLPMGKYRLQFDIDDQWSTGVPILPDENAENCKDVFVGFVQELSAEDKLNITFFESLEGELFPIIHEYWLEDIHLAPEFEGEKRYNGKVFTKVNGEIVEPGCNPVSFYYENGHLPFLVDSDRDGAMYCLECRCFFWEVKHPSPNESQIEPEVIWVRRREDGSGTPESV